MKLFVGSGGFAHHALVALAMTFKPREPVALVVAACVLMRNRHQWRVSASAGIQNFTSYPGMRRDHAPAERFRIGGGFEKNAGPGGISAGSTVASNRNAQFGVAQKHGASVGQDDLRPASGTPATIVETDLVAKVF